MAPKITKKLVLAAGLVVGLSLAGKIVLPAIADGAAKTGDLIDRDFQDACRRHIERKFFEHINATDDQRTQIDKVVDSTVAETYPLREQLREGLVQLNDLSAKDDTTDDQILQKAHELRALHEQIADKALDAMLKIRKVMTSEQRKQVAGHIDNLLTGKWKHHRDNAAPD
ncbi:MAG TPA: Spy/CpxP family protein refolding chaperone [Planktothrix sp.]|jgi:Spy/CpxP family protein refolding chaperone